MRRIIVVAFLILPFFLCAGIADQKQHGVFKVSGSVSGKWQTLGEVSFSEFKKMKRIDLPESVSRLLLQKIGGGVSHIDMVRIDEQKPVNNDLLSSEDKALYHVNGDVEVNFKKPGKVLKISARIEPEKILPFAFDFPKVNQFKKIKHNSAFYRYGKNSAGSQSRGELFNERTVPGSGHPVGNTIGYVWNDSENLYVKVDFTPDNTVDGGKDYTSVHIRQGKTVKTFKMSASDKKWGTPEFRKTENADYPHKVYTFKIPLSEIESDTDVVEMAFSAYGTAAPQLILTDGEGFKYRIPSYNFYELELEGDDDHRDYVGEFGVIRVNGSDVYSYCENFIKGENGRMFTCDKGLFSINPLLKDAPQAHMTRSLYVPSGKNYARLVTTVTNPGSGSLSFNLGFQSQYVDENVTYDFQNIAGSLVDPGAWVAIDTSLTTLVKAGEMKYGNGEDVDIPAFSQTAGYETTWSVTIPAGESVSVIQYFTQNNTYSNVTTLLNNFYNQSEPSMFAGLDSKIISSVINWQLDDNDSDGMIDQWEDANGLDSTVDDADSDKDGDGLTNKEEYDLGSDPQSSDSDEDGIDDKTEYDSVPQTDLTDSDSDDDGFYDGDEVLYGSDPLDDGDYPQISAGTYYVDPEAEDLGHGTLEKPWRMIDYAFSILREGATGDYTLKLANGIHHINTDSSINISTSNLKIEGSGNTVVSSLIQDMGSDLFSINTGSNPVSISNVTFEANGSYGHGAAVRVNSSAAVIKDCVFIGFDEGVSGEGNVDVIIEKSIFLNNRYGVEMYVTSEGSKVAITNSYFASHDFPTLEVATERAVMIINSNIDLTFEHNTVDGFEGVGLYLTNITGLTTVKYNVFNNLDIVIRLDGMTVEGDTQIHNNFLYDFTTAATQSLNGSLFTHSGNVTDTDPLIVTDEFMLQKGSPAIDSVDDAADMVTEDIEGKPRPYGTKKDAGCWEYYPDLTVTFTAGENGSIEGDLNQKIYESYSATEVKAVPDTGYEFSGWTGDYTGNENPLTVENVTANMAITANFVFSEVPDEAPDETLDEVTDEIIDEEIKDEAADEKETKDETESPDEAQSDDSEKTDMAVVDPDESQDSDEVDDDSDEKDKKKSGGCSLVLI